jgi:hypothetical protein
LDKILPRAVGNQWRYRPPIEPGISDILSTVSTNDPASFDMLSETRIQEIQTRIGTNASPSATSQPTELPSHKRAELPNSVGMLPEILAFRQTSSLATAQPSPSLLHEGEIDKVDWR